MDDKKKKYWQINYEADNSLINQQNSGAIKRPKPAMNCFYYQVLFDTSCSSIFVPEPLKTHQGASCWVSRVPAPD